MFGGIHDVTRELNDLCVFSLNTNEWIQIDGDDMSPRRENNRLTIPAQQDRTLVTQSSPGVSLGKRGLKHETPHDRSIETPLIQNTSVKKRLNTAKQTHGTVRPSNTLAQLFKTFSLEYTKPVRLDSPTSVRMQDSFLIKNQTASNFETYFKTMRKKHIFGRKQDDPQSPSRSIKHYGSIKGHKPAARDGHTGVVVGDVMIIFGGDRNRMPFNDTFKLDIRAEFEQHRL